MAFHKKRSFWIGAALIALCATGVAFLGFHSPGSSRLEQAREDAARGARYSAIKQYIAYLDESPEDHGARLELAVLLKPLDSKAALEQLQEIPPSTPEYPEAIRHIAHIAVVGKLDDLAEDALQKLDQHQPDDPGVVLSLAELYYRTRRYAESLPWTQQAARLQPDRARTWLLLAEVLDNLKRPEEMLEPLRKATELDSDLYPAHANLAYALQYSGNPEEAETQARWCLTRQPEDIRVRRWLAMILRDRGEYDAAMNEIRLAVASSPTDIDCRIVEADLLLFRREAEDAYTTLIPLYGVHSNRRDYLSSLARAAAMSGRREESRRYQQEIVQIIDEQAAQANPSLPVPEESHQ
ncbi:MAG TPA: tetratricopeptide repeat protein [Planctomycetaceae bacterium]|nr:tetratricopeptide repeat protein [Planctomycetaceae bacterium]HQZ65682.1 tetratricopeptide repeat protein [Planctomycetaceae bacterium]HRA86532.1 tetratricopeptide repeat protein [Planctomycetaceae bacterium]